MFGGGGWRYFFHKHDTFVKTCNEIIIVWINCCVLSFDFVEYHQLWGRHVTDPLLFIGFWRLLVTVWGIMFLLWKRSGIDCCIKKLSAGLWLVLRNRQEVFKPKPLHLQETLDYVCSTSTASKTHLFNKTYKIYNHTNRVLTNNTISFRRNIKFWPS